MKLFRRGRGQTPGGGCRIEFDENGRALSITPPPPSAWAVKRNGRNTYHTRSAGTLLEATEILGQVEGIPENTYYVVDTSDGSLGRDLNGFFTEAPLETK